MKRFACALVVLMTVCPMKLAATAVDEKAAPAAADGWTILFDGKDLAAFQEPGAKKWLVQDGVLAYQKGCGNLWTKEQFGDFVLDLEVKCAKGTNSGIFLRSPEAERDWLHRSIEIQVAASGGNRKPGKHDMGAVYDVVAPSVAAEKPVGEWNHVVITFVGNSLKIDLNDQRIVDADLDQWTEAGKNPDGSKNKFRTAYKDMAKRGHLGLQDHGQEVWYRNVKVKRLDR